MNRTIGIIAAAGLAVVLTTGAAFAAGGRQISAQKKQASDAQVSTGLAQEQAALSALQGGNTAQAATDLQAAVTAMHQALPIYHGYRARSMRVANRIATVLTDGKTPKNETRFLTRVEGAVNKAIVDAQTALQNSSTTVTPEGRARP